MTAQNAAPPGSLSGEPRGQRQENGNSARVTRPPSKRQRVIHALLRGPQTSFDLERVAHDHCSPSTISELRQDGLVIYSQLVPVPGFGGQPAHVAQYTLAAESRDLAIELMTRSGRRVRSR